MKSTHLLTLALLLLSHVSLDAAQPGKTQNLTSPDQVPEGLAKSDWSSIRAAYEAGRHAFMPTERGWQARNPGQQWTTQFDGRGFLAKPKEGDWTWGLELRSYGVGEKQTPVGANPPQVKAAGQRLTYDWDATLQEWWVNDQRGLEHGYIVRERPGSDAVAEGRLSFLLSTRGNLSPKVADDAQGVLFADATGATVLNYTGLKVWDADGKVLASRFEAAGEKAVRLLVEDRAARYPLTIDPIAQQAYVKPAAVGTSQVGDQFGYSVAVSGDTVVVGAYREDSSTTGVQAGAGAPDEAASGAGAAYVFVRSAGVWTQQAYLKPAAVGTTQANDQFGYSVAVAGDTVVVGANQEDSSTTGVQAGAGTPNESALDSGAAYVFVRSAGVWTQEAYLKPAAVGTTQAGDEFGYSVAVSGDTVVVGANLEDSSTLGVAAGAGTPNESASSAGAAYVFVRSAGVWTQEAYLKPAAVGTTQANDQFGISVAVAGDTVVVGAYLEDSDTTGVQAGAGTPNDAGFDGGAAYVFVRSAGVWTQQAYLKPAAVGTTQAGDRSGISVAVSGDTVVVGAFNEGSSTTGVQAGAGTPNESSQNAGAAYVFVRSAGVWTQQAYLKPAAVGTSQAYDFFGTSVAVAGDTVVVGARLEDSSTTGVNSTPDDALGVNGQAGAAYVFVRSAGVWTQQAYLKPAAVGTTQAGDIFGFSVAVSGDTVVVGAQFEDSSTLGVAAGAGAPNESAALAGAAYVFTVVGPTVTGITPSGGPTTGGTTVTITGPEFNLASTTMVTLGGVAATGVTVLNGTTITATTGAHATGLVDVVVTNFGGPGTGTNLFRYASNTLDTDGDGLNDAAELVSSAQGFDWQVAQPALVNSFRSGLDLYTPAQVQALKVGTPLIQRHPTTGVFTLTIGVEKSTTLAPLSFTPFSMLTAPGAAATLNGAGELEFQFTAPDNAAFFQLQSQ